MSASEMKGSEERNDDSQDEDTEENTKVESVKDEELTKGRSSSSSTDIDQEGKNKKGESQQTTIPASEIRTSIRAFTFYRESSYEDNSVPYFRDGVRQIDWILVCQKIDTTLQKRRRALFLRDMLIEGLHIEVEPGMVLSDKMFIKIHVPTDVLSKTIKYLPPPFKKLDDFDSVEKTVKDWIQQKIDAEIVDDQYKKLISEGHQAKNFTELVRVNVVFHILHGQNHTHRQQTATLPQLLKMGTYIGSYPLHDGAYEEDPPSGTVSQRRILYKIWANPLAFYQQQPLDHISQYFGGEVGLYFSWLFCYTGMLVPASLVGLMCFLYGLFTLESDTVSKQICSSTEVLCPQCKNHQLCPFLPLNRSCSVARVSYLFDNTSTVLFAIFMSFWAAIFMVIWKRKLAVLTWQWDLGKAELNDDPRQEYIAKARMKYIDPITGNVEPYIPPLERVWRLATVIIFIVSLVVLILGMHFGIIVYKIQLHKTFSISADHYVNENAAVFANIVAATTNIILIFITSEIYYRASFWLTDWENPRTELEYGNSVASKIFAFEFINCFSTIVYFAFFKNHLFTYPGDKYIIEDTSGLRSDTCGPTGCLSDVFFHLSIVMVGKQLAYSFEFCRPTMINWLQPVEKRLAKKHKMPCWEKDFLLSPKTKLPFEDYLPSVLQYGFLTLFVAAFPLAPLIALINNIAHIRLKGYKILTKYRRPSPRQISGLHIWVGVIQGITYAAVVSNAFMIAFTSSFIPSVIYYYKNNFNYGGYVDYVLSVFAVCDYNYTRGTTYYDTCKYVGYRYPPEHVKKYELTSHYHEITVMKLIFAAVFEHVILLFTGVLAYIIPIIPKHIKRLMSKEYVETFQAKQNPARKSRKKTMQEDNTPSVHVQEK